MSHILLANLGNRSMSYCGKTHQDLRQDIGEITFLDWTKYLLEYYDDNKEKLDLNIINPLFNSDSKPSKIILFYSDQSSLNTRIDQDTIYEAEILKKILFDKYGYSLDQIELIGIKQKVIETGKLTIAYRKHFKAIRA